MSLVTIPLLGYAPDLDPATPGVFSYCNGMEPTQRGWRLMRALTGATGISLATNDVPKAAYYSRTVDGTEVVHAAITIDSLTKDRLYLDVAGVLTNKSRAASYTKSGSTVVGWSFCQYGNYTLATNFADILQIRDASTSNIFADSAATNIPKASICVTWGPPTSQRVMLLDYDDGTHYSDGWWSSASGGPTQSWTPDIGTGAASGRLFGTTIKCGVAYGDDIIVFGDRATWRGSFVGPPSIVEWKKLSDDVGCGSAYSAAVLNGVLYFVGEQGLWQYDGNGLRPVALPIQQQIINDMAPSGTSAGASIAADGGVQRLRVDAGGTSIYSISFLSSRVGQIPYAFTVGADTLDVFGPMVGGRKYLAMTRTGLVAKIYTENPVAPYAAASTDSFGLGLTYLGSDKGDTRLKRVIPRFTVRPATYIMTDYYGPTSSEITTADAAVTVSATPWRADMNKSARWHGPRLIFTSSGAANRDVEVVDCKLEVDHSGNQ